MSDSKRTITVSARPEPLTLDLDAAAVIVIDMQNDFGSKGGMFDMAGIDISGIQEAVAPTARVIAACREIGMKIIYITMQHRADLSDTGGPESPHHIKHQRMQVGKVLPLPDGRVSTPLKENTWNTEILDALKPLPGDIIVPKHRYSAFYQTDLDTVLKSLGVRTIIVTGCTTSICVDSTIRDATFRDYKCLLLEDCTAEPVGNTFARSNHDATLLSVELLFGWVSDSKTLISKLAGK